LRKLPSICHLHSVSCLSHACLMYIVARWLSCLHCLHCRLTARWSWGRFPHVALVALGGRSGLSPRPFCVEFACSPRVHKGFPPSPNSFPFAHLSLSLSHTH